MGSHVSTAAKAAIHAAGAAPVPGASAGGDVLIAIINLCEAVAQKRSSARYLAKRCESLYVSLGQYEKIPVPKRTVPYRDRVFKCLHQVKDMMTKWAEKSWFYMLIHQGEFEGDLVGCDKEIFDCFLVFTTASHMEGMAHQEEEKCRRSLERNIMADHEADEHRFASSDFVRQVKENELTVEDEKMVSTLLQRALSTVSEHKRKRMAENLHELLRSSGRVPPELQLNSGEVEWPKDSLEQSIGGNVDIYKGRYLHSEDVRIKVIRSVNMKDENTVKRIRREVELWAKIYQMDKGKHILPFYGFCSPNGLSLALVSPWINNGDALTYVKKRDNLKDVDYRKLILGIAEGIKLLHSMFIVHGNLRAENVLIGDEGQPLITDFALAKLEGNLITQTADQSDSCRWCPPEIFEAQAAVSAKGDIYSFGMTILQLFTHEMPYSGIKKSILVVFKKGQGELPNRPKDERVVTRGMDDRMWELLCRCWSKKPDDRPSIEELVQQFSSPVSETE